MLQLVKRRLVLRTNHLIIKLTCPKQEWNVQRLASFFKKLCGATAIEYALIASMIAAILAVTIGLLGQDLKGAYQAVVDMFP